jgi:dynein heavy chain
LITLNPHAITLPAFCCRLAAYICGYSTVTIVISGNYSLNNFREDLQKMYKRAGLKGEGLLFLFTDSQVVDERMLVYVNDLLASGEIPDLFAQVRGWRALMH